MILISAGLVLAAVVLLIAGFVLAKPFLIMWSIVVSVLSALFLVIGAFLRRHELFPGGGRAAAPATPPPGLMPPGLPYNQTGSVAHQPPQQQTHPHPTQRPVTAPAPVPRRPPAGGPAPDAIVLVIPGRRRYHVAGCRQLAGREHEELTYEEAREEGFTPCTTCLPDAALGGRQLPPAADPEPASAPGAAFAAESRAETSAETRDVRPPVAPPKPDPRVSTPGPEPAAAEDEGATGWFGRPAAASAGQAKTPSAASGGQAKSPSAAVPESDDEQAETQTSFFRPPPYARRGEPTPSGEQAAGRTPSTANTSEAPGATSRPSREPSRPEGKTGAQPGKGEPSSDMTEPSLERPGQVAAGAGETEPSLRRPDQGAPPAGQTRPGARQQGPAASRTTQQGPAASRTTQAAAQTPGRPEASGDKPQAPTGKGEGPVGKGQAPTGKGEAPSGKGEAPSATSETPPGKAETPPGKGEASAGQAGGPTGKPAASAGKPGVSAGKPARPGEAPAGTSGRPGGSGPQRGRPGPSASADDEDDSSGPATAPQPRVPPSAVPSRPAGAGASSGSGVPSQRPSGPSKTFRPREPEEDVVLERPASSAESEAKPKGPLPMGPGAPGTGSKGDVSGATSKAEPAKGAKDQAGARTPDAQGKGERSGLVKVIVGTRRYHSTACPLIKGAGDTGVETMTVAAAEAAGLTSCSVCQHDRETVG